MAIIILDSAESSAYESSLGSKLDKLAKLLADVPAKIDSLTVITNTLLTQQRKIMADLQKDLDDVQTIAADETAIAAAITTLTQTNAAQQTLIEQLQATQLTPAQQAIIDQIDSNLQTTHAAFQSILTPAAPPAGTASTSAAVKPTS